MSYIQFSQHILHGINNINEIALMYQRDLNFYFIEAIRANDTAVVEKMLKIGFIPMNTRYIMNVCTTQNIEILKHLLKWRGNHGEKIDVRFPDNLPILAAIQGGCVKMVAELLAWRGPRLEQIVVSPFILEEACRSGNTNIVRLLLEWRGPHEEQVMITENCMTTAITLRYTEIVRILLAWRGPNLSKAPIDHLFDKDDILTIDCIEEIAQLLYVPIIYIKLTEACNELIDIKKEKATDASSKVILEQNIQDYLMVLVAHIDLLDEEQRKDIYAFIENESLFRGMNTVMIKEMFRFARRSPKVSARRSPKTSVRRSPKTSVRRSPKASARRSPFGKRR